MIYGVPTAVSEPVAASVFGSFPGDGFMPLLAVMFGCFGLFGTTSNAIVGSERRMCSGMIVFVPKIKA